MADSASDLSTDIDAAAVAMIRGFAVDGPLAANSGHQGTAVALAPLAHVLWTRVMRFDPEAPAWFDRDRFVLSAGHASILQYTMLYLSGYPITLDDLKAFRSWGSATPGHPEAGHTPGVEVTTGPLGQGLANSVGMAIAEAHLRAQDGSQACNHHTWVIASDGDMMEGISHEAASLAGHLQLGRLNVIYDDNRITIDGSTEIAMTDDTAARFRAYGWEVVELGDIGEDLDALEAALLAARDQQHKPTLLILRTHIAYPSPTYTDDPAAHGLSFSDADVTELKGVLGIPDEAFYVDDAVLDFYADRAKRSRIERRDWQTRNPAAPSAASDPAVLDAQLDELRASWRSTEPKLATRQASAKALEAVCAATRGAMVGSADLSGNTGTKVAGFANFTAANPEGRSLAYGIREHAMGAVMVGAALHGGILPVAGTFLVFSDYMRPAIRLAALSGAKCVFVYSHDSVAVGEDGPTHQPVEHVMSLRLIPGLSVLRPADCFETAAAWRVACDADGPVAMILSRQGVPYIEALADRAPDGVARGAYVVSDVDSLDAVIVATGSELGLAMDAAAALAQGEDARACRVVSMPSWDRFEAQDAAYRRSVFPDGVPVVSVEAGVTTGWQRYAERSVGIDRFGASAPGAQVLAELGVTTEAVVEAVRTAVAETASAS